ncbi:hypothetical protein C7S18_16475 [Ahniella affigens]|uniref:Chemotaxis protein CheA n=1 Tax=Ahniella affigens TaxID=2021234 RepID=A0A2P1PV74_9GAMM|nr:response regulator [Ahniella affigens]AVP98684.1 hypothetical protein C7S18_16475 [Ahniella affigens]
MTETLSPRAQLAEQLQALASALLTLDEPGEADESPEALAGLVQRLAQQALLVGAKGLPELLRLLAAGLRDRVNNQQSATPANAAELVLWCQHAAALQIGMLPPESVELLLAPFAEVPWIPPIIPRMHEVLISRLIDDARTLYVPDADAAETPSPPGAASVVSNMMDGPASDCMQIEPYESMVVAPFADIEASPTGHGGNWISADEMALAVTALSEQLLPQLDQLSQNTDAIRQPGLIEDFHYHFTLILNALELLNLPAVQSAGDVVVAELAILRDLAPRLARPGLERISNWLVCLLGWFHTEADSAMAEAFVETLADPGWPVAAESDAQVAVLTEMSRVRVGRDPSLFVEAKTQAHPEDLDLTMAADVVASVREGMLRELPRNCEQLRLALAATCDRGQLRDIDDARRYAHTLKGDANTVGVRGIANVTHALEDLLVALARAPGVPAVDVGHVLLRAADCVEAMADHLLGRGAPPDDAQAVYQQLLDLDGQVQCGERELTETAMDLPAADVVQAPKADSTPVAEDAHHERHLQVPVSVLDELLRLSSETIVLARQVEAQLQQIGTAQMDLDQQNRLSRDLVNQLDDLVALRGAALQSTKLQREREVDALEMDQYNELHVVSRRLIETSADASAHLHHLDRSLSHARDLAAQQERVHQALQQSVLNTRSVPFASQVPRFQRVVRQTSRQLDKPVSLDIVGEQTPIDADILEQIAEPLVHALRNAIDHGIEAASVRAAVGKAVVGQLRLEVRRQAGDILIRLRDDGAGFDHNAIRRVAIQRGLLDPSTPISPEQALQLVMLPGFSTRDQATHVSGRGMGMDVLARRVRALRGSVQVRSTPGQGASLELVVPASLNAAHVVLARTRDGVIAAVTGSIERFVPLRPEDYDLGDSGRLIVKVDGQPIPAVTLDALCGSGTGRDALEQSAIGMLIHDPSGQSMVVVTRQIDELREVIVKGLGRYLAPINGLLGTTILGTGGLAPVVDLALMLEHRQDVSIAAWSAAEMGQVAKVLVVDDSLSVRRALATLMQDIGFVAVTARDGLEALEHFSKGLRPVCILLDLEMPRMNGLELSTYVRNNEWLQDVPIIMITSRTSERHRELARDAGVTTLLTKPYQDDALVQIVERLSKPAPN